MLPKDAVETEARALEAALSVAVPLPRTLTFFAALFSQCWAAVLTASAQIELRFPAPGATLDAAWMLPSAACDAKGSLVDGTAFPAVFVGDDVVSKAVVWRKKA